MGGGAHERRRQWRGASQERESRLLGHPAALEVCQVDLGLELQRASEPHGGCVETDCWPLILMSETQ